jgi:4-diphosphocytidyl-2-C-methyl-D-erythritol kinase
VTAIGTGPVEVVAPAKLTLSLRITGVRADGYHLLEAEMVTLDLADTLFIEDGDGLSISREPVAGFTGWQDAPISTGPDNLVARALVAVGRTARVHVAKRVPPGAGLGGGSADAAAILRWAACSDRSVAAGLGADVPFCVAGGRAMVRGIGEVVEPLSFEERHFTLLLLPFGVDTGSVYRVWDDATGRGTKAGKAVSGNELEAAAVMVEPRLNRWRLLFEVITGRRPQLAGSGSTWFVEGRAEELGIADGRVLELAGEQAVVVSARTSLPTA